MLLLLARVVIMPNGHRLPYTLGGGPNGNHDVPSPLHTSDEEDVWVAKCRWQLLGRWVYGRWRLFVAKRRANASRSSAPSRTRDPREAAFDDAVRQELGPEFLPSARLDRDRFLEVEDTSPHSGAPTRTAPDTTAFEYAGSLDADGVARDPLGRPFIEAVVSDELSYRWKQAEVIEELKVGLQVGQLQVGQLQAEVDKQAEVIDDLKAIVNQLKLQVGQLQVAGPAPVQAQIVQVDVVESC